MIRTPGNCIQEANRPRLQFYCLFLANFCLNPKSDNDDRPIDELDELGPTLQIPVRVQLVRRRYEQDVYPALELFRILVHPQTKLHFGSGLTEYC